MTPDDHYREAQRLLGLAESTKNGSVRDRLVAPARVHAVLAVREAAPVPRRQQARAG